MTHDVSSGTPAAVRRLDSPAARELADLAATFDDLQTVLRCCERLMAELGAGADDPDPLTLEAFWTTAMLSYARCFSARVGRTRLTTDDVTATGLAGDVLGWHKILLQLRAHYADRGVNPRERFSVGVAQDADGKATGLAITSTRQPPVDDVTVRQTGALAFELSRIVDRRIAERQEAVFGTLGSMTKDELDRLPLVEVAAEA
ncbi:MAG: hypothetical protein ACXV4A_10425 [Actinomycetes bacterium]